MRSDEPAPRLYRVLHAVLPPMINAVWRPWAEGLGHVPQSGPAILASNHLSFLDSVFLPAALDRPVFFLGKSEYFTGWQRFFFEGVGVVPVHRQGGDAGEASLSKGAELLSGGHLLGIYPEGTRSPDGRLYRGKTGPVRLALRTGAPVLPVAMIGTDRVLPIGAKVPRVRPVGIRIGAPLDFAARYGAAEGDQFALRTATDELVYELMLLSGQEYVDEYAAKVKSGEVRVGSGDLDLLGQIIDAEDDLVSGVRAS